MKVTGLEYGLLYACFGLGAASGAIAVGSVLVGYRRDRVIAVGLAATGLAILAGLAMADRMARSVRAAAAAARAITRGNDESRVVADGPVRQVLADAALMEAHGLEVPYSLRERP